MPESYSGGNLVDVLATGAGRTGKDFFQILKTNTELFHPLNLPVAHNLPALSRLLIAGFLPCQHFPAVTKHACHPEQLGQKFVDAAKVILIEKMSGFIEQR